MLLWRPEFPVLLGAEIVDKPPEDPGVAAVRVLILFSLFSLC